MCNRAQRSPGRGSYDDPVASAHCLERPVWAGRRHERACAMHQTDGWMGDWMGGGIGIWMVIAVLVVVLLVVVVAKGSRK